MLPSLVPKNKINSLLKLAKSVENIFGDYWELGVYQGGTASNLIEVIPSSKKLILFDSFEGLPEPCIHDNHHKKGDFADVNLNNIQNYFKKYSNTVIIKGWLPDTLNGFEGSNICFAHIDIDLYEGHKAALEFIWPRLSMGGIIVFDDYDIPTCLGVKKAVDEFILQNNITLHKSDYQYFIISPFKYYWL